MKEIEVKFRVKRFEEIRKKLKRMGARLVWKGVEITYSFDTPEGSLRAADKQLRLRRARGWCDTVAVKVRPAKKKIGRASCRERV